MAGCKPDTAVIRSTGMRAATLIRLAGAAGLAITALVHLDLYLGGYRHIDTIGPLFLVNVIAGGLLAIAVAARPDVAFRVAGIVFALGTIGGFILSRRGDGLFDFRETGFEPSPQAAIALIAEIVTVVALAAGLVPVLHAGERALSATQAAGAAVIVAATLVVYGVATGTDGGGGAAAPANDPFAVSISGFAFHEANLSVHVGDTVTWTNSDGTGHSVVALDRSFISDTLEEGRSFEHTFDTAGTFEYICAIHPQMEGTITVG
jgi:plastocyanin